jgi:hypothetical protein
LALSRSLQQKRARLGVSLVKATHTRFARTKRCAFWFELKSQCPADETSMFETQRPGQSQNAKSLVFSQLKNYFYFSKLGNML